MKENFVWGVATAAYQIEGGYREDGKGDSIWDTFCHDAGRTLNGDNGDVACDHYHRFREDVKLMAELKIDAYRFSVAWSRVLAQGIGAVNEKGLRFYEELTDELLKYGITPYVTLYHWDLPQALFERGGWLNPDSPAWFAEYARLIAERLKGKVKHFITISILNKNDCRFVDFKADILLRFLKVDYKKGVELILIWSSKSYYIDKSGAGEVVKNLKDFDQLV